MGTELLVLHQSFYINRRHSQLASAFYAKLPCMYASLRSADLTKNLLLHLLFLFSLKDAHQPSEWAEMLLPELYKSLLIKIGITKRCFLFLRYITAEAYDG